MAPIAQSAPPACPARLAIATPARFTDGQSARRARLINVLLPGAGLIAYDRSAAGLTLGLAFYLPLTVAFYQAWLAPTAQPAWATVAWTVAAMAAYLANQFALVLLLRNRARRATDYLAHLAPPLTDAYAAMARGQWLDAQLCLDAAASADPENVEVNLTQARLLAIQRKFDQARQAYQRCRRLDRAGRWDWEIDRELALLGEDARVA